MMNRYTGTTSTDQWGMPLDLQRRIALAQSQAWPSNPDPTSPEWQQYLLNHARLGQPFNGSSGKPEDVLAGMPNVNKPRETPLGGGALGAGGGAGAAGGSAAISLPANNTYPTTPAALSADEIAELDQRRIALDQLLAESETQLASGTKAANAEALTNSRGMLRDVNARWQSQIGDLSSRGLGLSPAAAGRARNQLAEERGRQYATIESQRLGQIQQLAQRRDQSARQRAEQLAAINRLVASRGGDVARLFPGVKF